MLSQLASGLTGPLAACIAWLTTFIGLGLHVGYFIARREGAAEAVAHLPPARFVRACTLAFGGIGALSALVLAGAAWAGTRVELPLAAATLLVAFLLGSALSAIVRVPQSEGDGVRGTIVGGWSGVTVVVVLAAAVQYADVTGTLFAGTAAGVVVSVGWLAARRRLGLLVRWLTGQPRRPPVGLAAVEVGFAAAGFAVALACVAVGVGNTPSWAILTLLGALAPALLLARYLDTASALWQYRVELAASGLRPYRVTLAGFETTVIERAGVGAPILLLHGFGVDPEVWREVMEMFEGHRLVAVSLPGISDGADPLADGPMLPQLKAFATAAAKDLFPGRKPPIPVGLSLGGFLCLDLVRRGVVTRAVVVGTAGIVPTPWTGLAQNERTVRVVSAVGRRAPARFRGALGVWGYRRGQRYPQEAALQAVRQRARDPETLRMFIDGGAKLVRELRADNFDVRELPPDAIVHFVWGEKDTISPPATAADKVRRLRRDLPIDILPGRIHATFREDPEEFVELLRKSPALTGRRRPLPPRSPAPAPTGPPTRERGGRGQATRAVDRRQRRRRRLLSTAAGVVVIAGAAARAAARRSTT